MVPMNTIKKFSKNKDKGKGTVVKISKANVRKQTGEGSFSSLMPVLRTVAPTIGKTLGLSALAGLVSEGGSQLVKKITGGQVLQVPNKELFRLAMMSDLLNKGQIRDLAKAHQNGSDMLFRITQKQVGNGIGSILASIAIPMVLDAIRGKGAPRIGKGGPRIGKANGGGRPLMASPPFIGTWGKGKKKSFQADVKNRDIKRPTFKKTVPMSNFYLLEWCKYLKIY